MNDYKVKILIIGTGFGGLCAAIRLLQEGENNFIILERKNDVGGVWRDNQYPGCACDVQSHLFSFSFAPNPNWSHTFSRQPEIHKTPVKILFCGKNSLPIIRLVANESFYPIPITRH